MTRLVRLSGGPVAYLPPDAIESLRAGGLVIYPTDTLYGIGVDPGNADGLSRLVAAKGREGRKPVPLLLDEAARAADWASHIPPAAARLMARYWPGALTIVLPALPRVRPEVTGGGGTVGLRVPDHPVPRALARGLGGAVTGTSANRSGNPGAWESAEEIVREFTGEVDWVLWDGPAPEAQRGAGNAPGRAAGSTVVRVGDEGVFALREGVIPIAEILDFLKEE